MFHFTDWTNDFKPLNRSMRQKKYFWIYVAFALCFHRSYFLFIRMLLIMPCILCYWFLYVFQCCWIAYVNSKWNAINNEQIATKLSIDVSCELCSMQHLWILDTKWMQRNCFAIRLGICHSEIYTLKPFYFIRFQFSVH